MRLLNASPLLVLLGFPVQEAEDQALDVVIPEDDVTMRSHRGE